MGDSEGEGRDAPSTLDVQWHPTLHEEWGHEQLYFMRLGFSPIYDRAAVKAGLFDIFAEHEVRSYVAYEVFGVYDVMLRLWLPSTTTQEAFGRSVETSLKTANLTMSDAFVARRQERNWLWEKEGRIVAPDEERVLAGAPTPAELNALQSDPGVFQEFVKAELIRPLPVNSGVKFFMVLPAPQNATNLAIRELHKAVGKALDQAQLTEASLYIGQGFGGGAVLIIGRVPFERYYDIGDKLIGEILSQMTGLLGVRPYTFPASSPGFLCYAERPPGTDMKQSLRVPTGSVEPLLEAGETHWMEAKGSACVPLKPLLMNDARVEQPNTDATKSFRRAVAGLLNASGGTVVLGALEKGRYPDEAISTHFGSPPQRGTYLCLGLDQEIADDRDAFELRIKQTLDGQITPPPAERVKVEFVEVEDRTLVLLRVQRPRSDWFYVDGQEFYARDGNRTNQLTLNEADRYKADNPRRKGGSQ